METTERWTLRAKVTHWPGAKRARTSSVFHTDTPTGPYRAIGPQWQNSREKPHVLAFWPTLWPEGSILRFGKGRQQVRAPEGTFVALRLQVLHTHACTQPDRSKSALPLCQVDETVGKVLFELNIINHKGLRLARSDFATRTH